MNIYTIDLIIVAIIIGLLLKKNTSIYARFSISSIFGVIYFLFLPYIDFYIETSGYSTNYQHVAFLILTLVSAVLALIVLRSKYLKLISVTLPLLFVIVIFIDEFHGNEIKNRISINTGFFDEKQANIQHDESSTPDNRSKQVFHNYTFTTDSKWHVNSDMGDSFRYLDYLRNEKKIAEARPRCFDTAKSTLAELSIKSADDIQKYNTIVSNDCYQTKTNTYACKLTYMDANKYINRIELYEMDIDERYGIHLDFVIYNNDPTLISEINRVINSTTISKNNTHEIKCLALAEWL